MQMRTIVSDIMDRFSADVQYLVSNLLSLSFLTQEQRETDD
jgi:hypothetical protein